MRLAALCIFIGQLKLAMAWQKVELLPDGSLAPRQMPGASNCSYTDTCSQCYGPGNVICQYIACFDPSAHEQCCGDASYCVAANNSCCGEVGPGKTGTDGVPAVTAPFSLPYASGTSFVCTPSDSGEECCQRGGSNLHWCSGAYPDQYCYNPSSQQFCCSNGVVCDDEGCCALISASPLSEPWTAAAASSTAPPSTVSVSDIFSFGSGAGPISTEGPTVASASTTATSTKSANAATAASARGRDAVRLAVAMVLGCVSVALL